MGQESVGIIFSKTQLFCAVKVTAAKVSESICMWGEV